MFQKSERAGNLCEITFSGSRNVPKIRKDGKSLRNFENGKIMVSYSRFVAKQSRLTAIIRGQTVGDNSDLIASASRPTDANWA